MSLIFSFSKYISATILFEWLGLKELMNLDSAVSSRLGRDLFLSWLREYNTLVNRIGTLRSTFIHIHRLNQVMWSCDRTGRVLKNESLVVIQNTLYSLKRNPNNNLEEIMKRFKVVRFDDVVKRRLEEDQLQNLLSMLTHVTEMHCISCPDNFFHVLRSHNLSSLLKLTISVNDYDYYEAVDICISQCTNLKFLNIGIKDRAGYRHNQTPQCVVKTALVHCRQLEFLSITSTHPTHRREVAMLFLHRPLKLRQVVMKVEPAVSVLEELGVGGRERLQERLVVERLIGWHQKSGAACLK